MIFSPLYRKRVEYIPEFHDCPCYNILILWLFFLFAVHCLQLPQMLSNFFSSIDLSHETSLVESLLSINSTIGDEKNCFNSFSVFIQHYFFRSTPGYTTGALYHFFHVGR